MHQIGAGHNAKSQCQVTMLGHNVRSQCQVRGKELRGFGGVRGSGVRRSVLEQVRISKVMMNITTMVQEMDKQRKRTDRVSLRKLKIRFSYKDIMLSCFDDGPIMQKRLAKLSENFKKCT